MKTPLENKILYLLNLESTLLSLNRRSKFFLIFLIISFILFLISLSKIDAGFWLVFLIIIFIIILLVYITIFIYETSLFLKKLFLGVTFLISFLIFAFLIPEVYSVHSDSENANVNERDVENLKDIEGTYFNEINSNSFELKLLEENDFSAKFELDYSENAGVITEKHKIEYDKEEKILNFPENLISGSDGKARCILRDKNEILIKIGTSEFKKKVFNYETN